MQQPLDTSCTVSSRPYASRMVKTATWRHGADLRDFRETKLRLSQQAAANKVQVSIGAYSAWERGTAVPKLESLRDIVERLGVPPEVVGYTAPDGWELVPSEWIRDEIAAAEERAKHRHEETMQALRDLVVEIRSR
jgi:transcriptional regulator with XRE-family HTH domain